MGCCKGHNRYFIGNSKIGFGNFKKINQISGGYVGVLDEYPSASAAYSIRRLKSDYANDSLEVREDSGNTQQDIGFTSNYLNTSSLLSFVGANNGFVPTFYDQSGSAVNATNVNASSQPEIVNSGSLVTLNSKAALDFGGSYLELTDVWEGGLMPAKSSMCIAIVGDFTTTGAFKNTIACVNSASNRFIIRQESSGAIFVALGSNAYTTTMNINSANEGVVINVIVSGSNYNLYITKISDGTTESWLSETISGDWGKSSNSFTNATIGVNSFSGSGSNFGKLQELIYWNSNQYSNLTGIRNNIKDYYTI